MTSARRRPRMPVLVLSGALGLLVLGVAAVVAARVDGRMTNVFEIDVGHCVNGVRGTGSEAAQFAGTPVVGCEDPHEAEVVASFRLGGDAYPGTEPVVEQARRRCAELWGEVLAVSDARDLEPFYFYPTRESWDRASDRTVHCLAMSSSGRTTGSLLDH